MAGPGTFLLVSQAAILVSAVLLPPTNLTISSRNFQHILSWDDPNNVPDVYYNVDYQERSHIAKESRHCANITSRQCDLTKDFANILNEYRARVWSCTQHQCSEAAFSRQFIPVENTLLGPPEVDVVPCDHCITVFIQLPVSHLWSEEEQRNVTMMSDYVYPLMSYSIHLLNATKVPSITGYFKMENATVNINLLPNTNYCVSVSLSASTNLEQSILSEPKCVITGPTPQEGTSVNIIILVVVCGLLLFGIVFFLIGMDRAGYICVKRKFFPRVLKSFSPSENRFSGYDDCAPSVDIAHVEIVEQKVDMGEDQGSEDKLYDGGYENRKKHTNNFSSTDASSGPDHFVTTSSEASGQVTSSSDEHGAIVGHPGDVSSESGGSGSSGTPLLAHAIDSSSGRLQFNNTGVFNVNLDSVSILVPVDVRTDLKPGGTITEEPDPTKNSYPGRISPNRDCSLQFLVLDPTDMDVQYSDCSEEDLSDNCGNCDSDDHTVSGYMRR